MDPNQQPSGNSFTPSPQPVETVPQIASSSKKYLILVGILTLFILALFLYLIVLRVSPTNKTVSEQELPTPTSFQIPSPTPTLVVTPLPTQYLEAAKNQAEADKKYGQLWSNVNKNYPWYNKLPLQTKQYFVFFDIPTTSFVADIYPSSPDQTSVIETNVKTQLTNLGIDMTKFTITWKIH